MRLRRKRQKLRNWLRNKCSANR